jgi:hypothetical protein
LRTADPPNTCRSQTPIRDDRKSPKLDIRLLQSAQKFLNGSCVPGSLIAVDVVTAALCDQMNDGASQGTTALDQLIQHNLKKAATFRFHRVRQSFGPRDWIANTVLEPMDEMGRYCRARGDFERLLCMGE